MSNEPNMTSNRFSRFTIPRTVIDPRGSLIAFPHNASSTVYPFRGPQPSPEKRQFDEYDDEKPLTRYDTLDDIKGDGGQEEEAEVLGSTQMFDVDGNLILVPVSVDSWVFC